METPHLEKHNNMITIFYHNNKVNLYTLYMNFSKKLYDRKSNFVVKTYFFYYNVTFLLNGKVTYFIHSEVIFY